MKNKYILKALFFSVFSFSCFYQTYALIITEVNFDPAGSDDGREWIEVYNESPSDSDFTTYKFFEANTNHGIDVVNGDKNISPSEYAVLVQDLNKFKTDFPSYTGKIFKSSFSLSNSGEVLSLKDSTGAMVSTVNYSPTSVGAKSGDTINFDGTNWVKGTASPGSAYVLSTGESATTTTTTSTTTETTSSTTISAVYSPVYQYRSYFPESEKIYLYVGENKSTLSGATTVFEANAVMGDKKPLLNATYFWSFGDGASAEGKTVKHIYKYPGEYTVNVEAYANGSKAEDKIYVKATVPNIKVNIKVIGGEKAVEIINQGVDEIDLGGFGVKTTGGEFLGFNILPKKLSILGKRSINIPQETLKFATGTTALQLLYENGKVLSEFAPAVLGTSTTKYSGIMITANTTSTMAQVFTKEEYEKWQEITAEEVNEVKKITKAPTKKIAVKKEETIVVKEESELADLDSFSIGKDKKGVLETWFGFLGI
jgi:hypothetical protein